MLVKSRLDRQQHSHRRLSIFNILPDMDVLLFERSGFWLEAQGIGSLVEAIDTHARLPHAAYPVAAISNSGPYRSGFRRIGYRGCRKAMRGRIPCCKSGR